MNNDPLDLQVQFHAGEHSFAKQVSLYCKPGYDIREWSILFGKKIKRPTFADTKQLLDGLAGVLGETPTCHSFPLHEELHYHANNATLLAQYTMDTLTIWYTAHPKYLSDIELFIEGLNTSLRDPHIEGVYSVFLDQKFIFRDEVMTREYERRTDDFDHIYDELYPRIDVPKLAKLYGNSRESMLILLGKAGTGKTSMIKKLICKFAAMKGEDIYATYVKDPEVLRNEQFWAQLHGDSADLLILDDLDNELKPREKRTGKVKQEEENENSIVNKILSFSDGVFQNETKIIVTTNQEDDHIDSALLRPGRCFDILNLPPLSRQEAFNVWTTKLQMDESTFDKCFKKGEEKISQALLISEFERLKIDAEKEYLLDQDISVRHKYLYAKTEKKMGFH